MAKRRNRNNAFSKGDVKASSVIIDNEYDLEKNFKKINAYSRNKQHKNKSQAPVTDSRDFDNNSFNSKYVETPINSSAPQLTGDNFAWDSYTRLESRITDFNYKNDQAHTELRRELESKIKESIASLENDVNICNENISKSLPKQWYVWTIIGLVAIVTIWYLFSYQDIHPLPRQIHDIDIRLNNIETQLEDIQQSDTTNNVAKH